MICLSLDEFENSLQCLVALIGLYEFAAELRAYLNEDNVIVMMELIPDVVFHIARWDNGPFYMAESITVVGTSLPRIT